MACVTCYVWSTTSRGLTYHGHVNNAIGKELVVQAREVGAAVLQELDGETGLDGEGIVAFDDSDKVLLGLLHQVALGGEVLDDVSWTVEAGRRGDVVQRRVLGEGRRAGRSQELLVHSLQRHTGDGCYCNCNATRRMGVNTAKGVAVMDERRCGKSEAAREGKENKRRHGT